MVGVESVFGVDRVRRWGDGGMGGWGDGETRRWGDGGMGRQGDKETRGQGKLGVINIDAIAYKW